MFMVNVGNHTSPMDPMGIHLLILWDKWLTCHTDTSYSPQTLNGTGVFNYIYPLNYPNVGK